MKALWETAYNNAKETLKAKRDIWFTINRQAREFKDTYLRKYKENN